MSPENIGATIDITTGAFSYTPTEDQGGDTVEFTVTLTDSDSSPLTDTVTLTFNVVELANQAPVINTPTGFNNAPNEYQTVTITLTGSDPDGDTPLAWSVLPADSGATIDASTGILTFTPTEDQGSSAVIFTVTLTDPGNLTDTEPLTFNVAELPNRAPVIAAVPNFNNAPNEYQTVMVNLTGSDPDGDTPLAWSVLPADSGATIDITTGVLTYTPTEDQGSSAVIFTVTLTDPDNLTDTETLTF